MTESELPVDDRVASRGSNLLPEEEVVGSEAPVDQAAVILAESDARQARDGTESATIEQRTSDEMTPPPDVA